MDYESKVHTMCKMTGHRATHIDVTPQDCPGDGPQGAFVVAGTKRGQQQGALQRIRELKQRGEIRNKKKSSAITYAITRGITTYRRYLAR